MADVLKIRGDLLGLGKSSIEPVKARKHSTSTVLAVATLALVLIGASSGAIRELVIEREKAEQAAADKAAAEEKAKNRERDARAKALNDLAMRYQYELEQQRKRVVGTIENAESYRDQIPQVKSIDRNNAYFNGYLKEMRIDEQFKREFGKRPMQQAPAAAKPQVEAEPVSPAEPVVEQAAVEPAAPVAEAAPAPKPAPAPRAAQPAKPKAVPVGGGRVQVTDW